MRQSSYRTVKLVLLKMVLKAIEIIPQIKTTKMERQLKTMEKFPKNNALLATQS